MYIDFVPVHPLGLVANAPKGGRSRSGSQVDHGELCPPFLASTLLPRIGLNPSSSPTDRTPYPRPTVSTSRKRVSPSEVHSSSTPKVPSEHPTSTISPSVDPSRSRSESSRLSNSPTSTEKSARPAGRRVKIPSILVTSSSTLASSKSTVN